jgi:hypothetical protein
MNEQEATLAAYKEYLLECANNDSLDFTAINNKYEHCCNSTPDKGWYSMYDGTVIDIDTDILFRHKKRTVVVNGKTVPAPMDRDPSHKEPYYFLDSTKQDLVDNEVFFNTSNYDMRMIRAGWFDNEQDASEYFKALLGIK